MTTRSPLAWSDALVKLSACSEAVEFARTQPDLATAWKNCERGDWMLWLAGRLAGPAGDDRRRPLTLAACGCARLALEQFEKRNSAESRPRKAIETAESWARNSGATLAEVRSGAAAAAAYAARLSARADALKRCADIVRAFYPNPPELSK